MDNRTRINIQGSTDGFLDRRAFIERGNDSRRLNNEQDLEINSPEKNPDIVYNNFNVVKNTGDHTPGIVMPNQHTSMANKSIQNNQPGFDPGSQNAINKFGNRLK